MQNGDNRNYDDLIINSNKIGINVLGLNNAIVQFKTKKSTPLRLLLTKHCNLLDSPKSMIRFRFNGQVVHDNDSPTTLEMVEGDTIEAY